MSVADRRPILRVAGAALAAVGYRKRSKAEVFTRPLADDVLSWVGLMTGRADDGVVEITPKVGVRHERIHRLADRLSGSDSGATPTVSRILGYLTPAQTASLVWRFDDPEVYDAQAENMVQAITVYGGPYMERNVALDELIKTLPTDGLYSEELLPAAHLVNGHPELAEASLARALQAMADRDDPAATAFRLYAERFRSELKPQIDSILPGVAAQLAGFSDSRLRKVARLAAHRAASRLALSDRRAVEALASIDAHHFGPSRERVAVKNLAEELDEQYWALEPTTDAGAHEPITAARLEAFRRARAASAVWAALDEDPVKSAFDALYEAWAALGSSNEAIQAILESG